MRSNVGRSVFVILLSIYHRRHLFNAFGNVRDFHQVRVVIICSSLFSVTLITIAGPGGNDTLFSNYLLRNPVERILFLRCLLPVAEEVHTADVTGTLKRGLSI